MLDAAPGIEQYIFCSSAGVYLKSDQMPHREEDAVDPKSRHRVRVVGTYTHCRQVVCIVIEVLFGPLRRRRRKCRRRLSTDAFAPAGRAS